MKKFQRRGRHSAAIAAPSTIATTGAVATTAGVLFGAALPAAVGADHEVTASEQIVLNPTTIDEQESFTVSASESNYSFGNFTVEAEEPVVEEPVVEATTAQATTTQATTQTTGQTRTQQTYAAAPAAAPVAAPQASGLGSTVVAIARQYAGAPYRWGGTTPAGWDCIGFARYVYAQVGVSLPGSSYGARSAGYPVPASQARPGDLMWWPGHVGIYTGNGMHIAAWNPSMGTQELPVWGNPIYLRVL